MMLPTILATATAVPDLRVDQETARDLAHASFETSVNMQSLYHNSGVDTRHSSVPVDWFTNEHNWPQRMDLYHEASMGLLEQVIDGILESADLTIEQIDMLITVSTTGIVIPSLDAQLIEHLPFRRDIDRLPVFGYGCAGGVMGIRRAADMALVKPGQNILMLVVELPSINFRYGDRSATNFVSSALFGDGAAGVLIRNDPASDQAEPGARNLPKARVGASGVYSWNDTLDVMGFSVEEDGFGVVLSPSIPTIAATKMAPPVLEFLEQQDLTLDDLDGYISHPGGRRVMDGMEEALSLDPKEMTISREILHEYGNMSAATVLFVLERTLQQGARGRYLMTAFGPGFSLALQLLEID